MAKTILVTGANRGIGLEIVRQYSAQGWRVIACCRHPQKAQELIQCAPFALLELDLKKMKDVERVVDQLKDESIDILMNNAGISGPSNEEFNWREPHLWLDTFYITTLAPYAIAQAFLNQVEKSQCKLIVNMSSAYGSIE